MKRTPLYTAHRRAGAKMVEFAGWEMPVQYQGVIQEHLAVRRDAGLFDVSHMGEIEIRGEGALQLSQDLTANDVSRMKPFQAQYNLLLNEQGGIVDDVIFYRLEPKVFFVCVNAANTDKDFAWIRDHAAGAVDVVNVSDQYAQLALQGPRAQEILAALTALDLLGFKSFDFAFADVAGIRCLVARTGYTGEDGFELYCHAENADRLWNACLDAGAPHGLTAAGLGARDTLRLEKAYPLYGHEIDDSTTPLEAGLEWVVKFSKGEFPGRDVLLRQKESGIQRKLVGLEMIGPGIARSEYGLFNHGRPIGRITSGTKSPSLGKSIALGYIAIEESEIGNIVDVEIRGRNCPARVVGLPFYRR
ncbi:MAG TPA: glycine cleavage system aminomethyltransferase GcvT [Candidatus Binatia bacterium]|jgi:aminomethyltransferase